MSDIVVQFTDGLELSVEFPQTGLPGKSAYQIAVDAGFVGTKAEWLESLKATVVWENTNW